MKDKKTDKEWILALGFLLLVLALAIFFYLMFSIAYGSLLPDRWTNGDGYWFVMIFGNLIILSVSYYVVVIKEVDIDKLIQKVFDIDELKHHKPAEAILSHYGNMASVGLLMALLVYTVKPFVMSHSVLLVGPFLASIFFILVMVYSVILMKPLICFSKYSLPVAMTTMFIILIIDMQGLRFFISSVP